VSPELASVLQPLWPAIAFALAFVGVLFYFWATDPDD